MPAQHFKGDIGINVVDTHQDAFDPFDDGGPRQEALLETHR